MRRFTIVSRRNTEELRLLSLYYISISPPSINNYNCKMELFNKNNFFFLTEFYSPYYYYEGFGSFSVMGVDYNNRNGINGQGFKEVSYGGYA
jgi:hypothetical protein